MNDDPAYRPRRAATRRAARAVVAGAAAGRAHLGDTGSRMRYGMRPVRNRETGAPCQDSREKSR